jgi:apolipoprotein D and lipocalin family protein
LCLLLVACAASAPLAFRNTNTQLYSTAAMPVTRLIGTWHQEASFGAPCQGSSPHGITFFVENQMARARYNLCLNGRIVQGQGMITGGQGRYGLPQLAAPIWVLWIDADDRTMVLGTPDGQFGMILSQDPIPQDRMRAAREILAWNGYDLAKMTLLR